MLSLACERKLRGEPPMIKLRKETRRESVLAEPWQEDMLIEHATGHTRDFCVVVLRGGTRPAEACALKWKDADFGANEIRIRGTKSDAAKRVTIMTEQCAAVLRERKRTSKSEWVFPSKRSKSGHMVPTSFNKPFRESLKPALEAACKKRSYPTEWIDGLVPYSLRHTFATNVQAATGDRAKTAKMMGHATPGMLDRYTHARPGNASAQMDAWEAERRKVVRMGKRA
jgi:integrase